MQQEFTQAANPEAQTLLGLTVRIMCLTKALQGYYDEHQARGCTCSLCEKAKIELRKMDSI
jgi:hypothetical protein